MLDGTVALVPAHLERGLKCPCVGSCHNAWVRTTRLILVSCLSLRVAFVVWLYWCHMRLARHRCCLKMRSKRSVYAPYSARPYDDSGSVRGACAWLCLCKRSRTVLCATVRKVQALDATRAHPCRGSFELRPAA